MKLMSYVLAFFIIPFAVAAGKAKPAKTETPAPAAAPATPDVVVAPVPPADVVFEGVKISPPTEVSIKGNKYTVKPVSYGIRKKKVFGLATVRVYVVEFLASKPENLVKDEDGILASLKNAEVTQLKLTLVRDISGKKIKSSFHEALEHNGVDLKKPSEELSEVLEEIGEIEEFKENQSFTITILWDKGTATMVLQKPNGKTETIKGPDQFATDLMSIWFGKPADDKLADLKKVLIK